MTKRPSKMNLLDDIQVKLITSMTAPLESTLAVMDELIHGLHEISSSMPIEKWQDYCANSARPHPLAELLREDPFTRPSVEKPRGYAGDAELIDYIGVTARNGLQSTLRGYCQGRVYSNLMSGSAC